MDIGIAGYFWNDEERNEMFRLRPDKRDYAATRVTKSDKINTPANVCLTDN